jgi:hypothetical protein
LDRIVVSCVFELVETRRPVPAANSLFGGYFQNLPLLGGCEFQELRIRREGVDLGH